MREGHVLVERYQIVRRVGAGAMGQVWLAHDTLLNRRVAIKHLLPGVQESLNDEFVRRAHREARLAASLNHPNAVQVYDLVTSDGMPHVVMEYVDGDTTLASRLQADGHIPPHVLRPVIRQVADCLAAAHALGIVHRDVKPANILIGPDGRAKLADFGIARAAHDANLTSTGLVIGTLAYMAPEVAAGDPATPSSDVWSLGATAYAATEGRAPFAGESSARMLMRKVSEPPPRPVAAGELTELLQAMMAVESAQRPAAPDVVRALEGNAAPRWLGATTSDEVEPTVLRTSGPGFEPTVLRDPVPAPDRPAARRSRHGLVAALIVLALAIAGGAVAIALSGGSGHPAAATTHSSSTTPSASLAGTTSPASTTASDATPFAGEASTSAPTTAPVATPPVATSRAASSGDVATFIGPNGLRAVGPASWDNSCPGAQDNWYWCAGSLGFAGGNFHLRLKTARTTSFAADVRSELSYFRGQHGGTVQQSPVSGWSLSPQAVDLTYTFTNASGEARQGMERVFTVPGASSTFIIAVTDVPGQWTRTQNVFHQLVDSASL